MKPITTIASLIMASALCVNAAETKQMSFNELPDPVKQTIKSHQGDRALKEIHRTTKDGRIVFEVEYNQPGANPKLIVAMDGTVIPDTGTRLRDRLARVSSLKLTDVPEPVRKTIQIESKGREVADIDRETWNRQTVYEVEFAQTGRNAQIHIAEDGSIVKDERAGTGLKGLFMGTQLADTPAPVQATIKREAANREIADIDKETRDGQTIYEVEFKQPGRNVELHIAENGTIIQDSRRDLRGQGTAPGETQKDIGRATGKLTINDVPLPVQQAIRGIGNTAALKPIEQKTENGKTVYHVEFEGQGINRRMVIAEDGTVLKDNKRP
jgi:uncharacterized membrane protein YkoI